MMDVHQQSGVDSWNKRGEDIKFAPMLLACMGPGLGANVWFPVIWEFPTIRGPNIDSRIVGIIVRTPKKWAPNLQQQP